jgi:drug/metabolite transporter (DMT)-like permease
MKLSPARKAIIALIIANIIWGAGSPIFKLTMETVPPFTLAFLRFFLGAAIMLFLFGPRACKPGKLFKTDSKNLLLYTLFGVTINIIFYFLGLTLTLSLNAPIIASTGPILIFIIAVFYLHEKIKNRKIIGVVTGTVGILLIVLEPLLVAGGIGGSILGNIFLIISTFGAVLQAIIGHKFVKQFDPIKITFWSNLIGSLTFIPFMFWEIEKNPNLFGNISNFGYFGIIWGSIFSSFLAYFLFAWGLSKLEASDVSLFTYIDPVIGAILSYFLLHEPITPLFLLGSTFIFCGIFIAEGRIQYHPVFRLLKKEIHKITGLPSINSG